MKSILQFKIYLQPGAKKTEIVGKHADAIKIKVHARPIDGEANKALIDFLSQISLIPKSRISIQSGEKSRLKKIIVECESQNEADGITSALS